MKIKLRLVTWKMSYAFNFHPLIHIRHSRLMGILIKSKRMKEKKILAPPDLDISPTSFGGRKITTLT